MSSAAQITESAVEYLYELETLLKLNGENPFKVRAFEKAQKALQGCTDLLDRARAGTLTEIEGIGKGIEQVLTDFLLHHKTTARDELTAKLPPGLLELTQIAGVGPKKARVLIDELGVHTVAELEYACRENRLQTFKGFGQKLQDQILKSIEEQKAYQNKKLWCDAEPLAQKALAFLRDEAIRAEFTGDYRRGLEVVSSIDFLVQAAEADMPKIQKAFGKFAKDHPDGLPMHLHFADKVDFGSRWFATTGTPAHLEQVGFSASDALPDFATEVEIYRSKKLEFIPPEIREGAGEVALAQTNRLSIIVGESAIQGVFHVHTDESDGSANLEDMVQEAERLGYGYIGISDHSQSAFYAHGLKSEAVKAQKDKIQKLQKRFANIRIFHGIESDILQDGSLDYPTSVLEEFDFVIGSVHSRFKMDREGMTKRILAAIQNPYTDFIGHLTGRLLLGREGYELDFPAIFAAAAKHQVVIELNAHPSRLDVDWRWGPELLKAGVMTSINPDAHNLSGLADIRFGITSARKMLYPAEQVLNTRSAAEVEAWFKSRRNQG